MGGLFAKSLEIQPDDWNGSNEKIPSNVENLIIVLGQCLLPNGHSHPFMNQRVDKAYSLLEEFNLDINNTYFIVSGSDVSNTEYMRTYGTLPSPKHVSEAEMMKQLLIGIHTQHSQDAADDGDDMKFEEHIILEEKAMTTIQNFYFCFLMIVESKVRDRIKQIFVVTSDFHIERARYNFDAMFFEGIEQIVGDGDGFDYDERVHFEISVTTSWKDEKEKNAKFASDERIMNAVRVRQQTKETAIKLWKKIRG